VNFDVSGIAGMGMGGVGKAQGPAHNAPGTPKVSASLQVVLDVMKLGGNLVFQRTPGVHLPTPISASLGSVQTLQPTVAQMESLRALGLSENIVLTLVVSNDLQRKRLKDRFKEVSLSSVEPSMLTQLESILGTEIEDAVLDDNGALIMLNGIKELKESIKEE
jgi:hypothetical protein